LRIVAVKTILRTEHARSTVVVLLRLA
jgi:hypothetical protein